MFAKWKIQNSLKRLCYLCKKQVENVNISSPVAPGWCRYLWARVVGFFWFFPDQPLWAAVTCRKADSKCEVISETNAR